jgi:hypothetical protein
MQYFKVLNADGNCCHGGTGSWNLPADGKPGAWMPKLEEASLSPCVYGYHVLQEADLIHWLGPVIFEVEIAGRVIRDGNKSVVAQARLLRRLDAWNEKTARLFAADCAEHVAHYFDRLYPNDHRPRQARTAAREYAHGVITSAAGAASAASIASIASADSADSAAWAARAARAARTASADSAASAARADSAAWAASVDSAASANWAELQWQTKLLGRVLRLDEGRDECTR